MVGTWIENSGLSSRSKARRNAGSPIRETSRGQWSPDPTRVRFALKATVSDPDATPGTMLNQRLPCAAGPPRGCLRRPPDVILVEKAILDLDINFVEPLFGSAHCNAQQLLKLDAFSATLPQQGRWRYRLLFELLHRALFRLLV